MKTNISLNVSYSEVPNESKESDKVLSQPQDNVIKDRETFHLIDELKDKTYKEQAETALSTYETLKHSYQHLINTKQFAHIHAGAVAKSSALEGNRFTQTLEHFIYFIENLGISEIKDDRILLDLLKNCLQMGTFHLQNNEIEEIAKSAKKIAEEISQLKRGRSYLLTGGYQTKKVGHAMLFLFNKDPSLSEGIVKLTVINPGDGLERYHPAVIKEGREFFLFVSTYHVPFKKLEKGIQALIELKFSLAPSTYFDVGRASYFIYDKVLASMGELVVPKDAPEQLYRIAQKAGFCSEDALHAFMQFYLIQKFGLDKGFCLYKKYLFNTYRFHTLSAFYSYNSTRPLSETDSILLTHGLNKQLTSSSVRLLQGKLASDLEERLPILLGISGHLQKIAPLIGNKELVEIDWSACKQPLILDASQTDLFSTINNTIFLLTNNFNENADRLIKMNVAAINKQLGVPTVKKATGIEYKLPSKLTTDSIVHATYEFIDYLESRESGNFQINKLLEFHLFDAFLTLWPMPVRGSETLYFNLSDVQIDDLSIALSSLNYYILSKIEDQWSSIKQLHLLNDCVFNQCKLLVIMHALATKGPCADLNNFQIYLPVPLFMNTFFSSTNSCEREKEWQDVYQYLQKGMDDVAFDFDQWKENDYKGGFQKCNVDSGAGFKFLKAFIDISEDRSIEKELETMGLLLSDLEGEYLPEPFALFRKQHLQAWVLIEHLIVSFTEKFEEFESWNWLTGLEIKTKQIEYTEDCEKITAQVLAVCVNGQEISSHSTRCRKQITPSHVIAYTKQLSKRLSYFNKEDRTGQLLSTILAQEGNIYEMYSTQNFQSSFFNLDSMIGKDILSTEELVKIACIFHNQKFRLLETISLFKSRLDLLGNSAYQLFFKAIVFQLSALDREFKAGPKLISELFNFIKDGYEYYSRLKKIETQLFFLSIADRIIALLNFNNIFPVFPIIDTKKELLTLYQHASTVEEKGLISLFIFYHELQHSHSMEDLPIQKATVFLHAWIYYQSTFSSAADHYHLFVEFQKGFLRFLPLLEKYFEKDLFRDEVLSAIIEIFEPVNINARALNWNYNAETCLYTDETNSWSISLTEGLIYIGQIPLIGLPSAVKNALEKPYANLPFKFYNKNLITIGYKNSTLPPLLIYYCGINQQLVISKAINQYLTYPLASLKISFLSPREKYAVQITQDVNHAINFLLIDKKNSRIKKQIICNPSSKDVEYVINKELSDEDFYLVDTMTDDEWKKPFQHLIYRDVKPILWQNKKENPTTFIEFPYLSLLFTLEPDSNKAYFTEAPDFYLVDHQTWTGLGASPYLLVQHKIEKDRLKVILPFLVLDRKQDEQDALSSALIPCYNGDRWLGLEKSSFFTPYFILDIDPKGHLIAQTTLEHLYVFYVYMAKSINPVYSELALQKTKSILALRPYTNQEKAVLSRIFSLVGHVHFSQHTKLLFLAVHALFSLLKNLEHESASSNKVKIIGEVVRNPYVISDLLTAYWQHRSSLPAFQLTKEDEFLLLTHLDELNALNTDVFYRAISLYDSKILTKKNTVGRSDFAYTKNSLEKLVVEITNNLFLSKIEQTSQLPVTSVLYIDPVDFIGSFILHKNNILGLDQGLREDTAYALNLLIIQKEKPQTALADKLKQVLDILLSKPEHFQNCRSAQSIKEFIPIFKDLLLPIKVDKLNHVSFYNATTIDLKKNLRFIRHAIRSLPQTSDSVLGFDDSLFLLPPAFESIQSTCLPAFSFSQDLSPLKGHSNIWLEDYNQDLKHVENRIESIFQIKDRMLFSHSLKESMEKQEASLKQLEKEILSFVKRFTVSSIQAKCKEIANALVDKKLDMTINDLISTFVSGTREAWIKINSTLSDKEIGGIQTKIAQYLIWMTHYQKCQRLEKCLQNIQSEHTAEINEYLEEELTLELNKERAYPVIETDSILNVRLLLAFEYLSDLLLTKEQYQILKNMISATKQAKNYIGQHPMGKGKTTVLSPLLVCSLTEASLPLSSTIHETPPLLPILCVPKELFPTQRTYLSSLTLQLFGQEARSFHFSNEDPLSVHKITEIYDMLCSALSLKQYLIVTKETLQALNIKYSSLLLYGHPEQPEELQIFYYLHHILQFLQHKAVLIIDEADSILNPRSELNLSIGHSTPLSKDSISFVCEIYDLLVDENFNEGLDLQHNKQAEQAPILYEKIKGRLVEYYVSLMTKDPLKGIQLSCYLKEEHPEIPEWIEKDLSAMQKDRLGFIKSQLNVYLPITLSKQGFKDYAFSASPSVFCAIHAANCCPVEGSLFGTIEETMNYTIQQLLHTGVKKQHVQSLIDQLKKEFIYQLGHVSDPDSLHASQLFASFYPDAKLTEIGEHNINYVVQKINDNPKRIIAFAKHFLLPRVRMTTNKIMNNSMDLVQQFYCAIGFTGTPWNRFAYPASIPVHLKEGTDGAIVSLLRYKASLIEHPIHFLEPINETFSMARDSIANLLQPFQDANLSIKGIVDTGAFLKDFKTEEIKTAFIDYFRGTSIKAIRLFIDNEIKVISTEGIFIDADSLQLKDEEIFTFFDNAHYIGANIVLNPFSVLVATLSSDLLIKDLLQGVSRARGLHKQQNIVYVGSSVCEKNMRMKLAKEEGARLTIDDVLTFTALVQGEIQSSDVFRQAKTSVTTTIRNFIKNKLLEISLEQDQLYSNVEKLRTLASYFNISGVFETSLSSICWKAYKEVQILKEPRSVLESLLKYTIDKIEDLHFDGQYQVEATQLRVELVHLLKNKLIFSDLKRMPLKIKDSFGGQLDSELQVQQMKMQEVKSNETQYYKNTNKWIWQYPLQPSLQRQTTDQLIEEQVLLEETEGKDEKNSDTESNSVDSRPEKKDSESIASSISYNSEEWEANLKKKISTGLLSIESVFNRHSSLQPFIDAFASNIYFSLNHTPLLNKEYRRNFIKPFQEKSKPAVHVLVEETTNNDPPLNFYIIDQQDLEDLSKEYEAYIDSEKDEGVKVWLYHTPLSYSHHETQSGLAAKWETHIQFKQAIFQIRLLNGEINYSEQDRVLLKDHIRKMGIEKFEECFKILIEKRDTRQFYEESIVKRVIEEIKEEQR